MATLQSALGNAAPAATVEFEGRKFTVSPLDYMKLADFGAKLRAREDKDLLASDMAAVELGLLTTERVLERKDRRATDALKSGRWTIGSPEMVELMGGLQALKETIESEPLTPEQMLQKHGRLFEPIMILVGILLGCDVSTAIRLYAAQGPELMDKVNDVLKESMPDAPK